MGYQNPNTPESWQQSQPPGSPKPIEQVEKSVEQLTSSAIDRVQKVREEAQSGLSEQLEQTAERIRRVGKALTTTSDKLREEDELVARYLDQAGERVERVASYVSSANMNDIAEDVRRFATERPAWFFGGAFILGLTAGRFFKSTASASVSPGSAGQIGMEEDDYPTDPSYALAQRRPAQQKPQNVALPPLSPPMSTMSPQTAGSSGGTPGLPGNGGPGTRTP